MKKDELRRDPIREYIVRAIQYLNHNSTFVFKILVVLLFSIAGISYFNYLGNAQSESASHLSGRAQNTFINGNLDDAIVKFERVVKDYPNTIGAGQALIYLFSEAIKNNNIDKINQLLLHNSSYIEDMVVTSAIFKIHGDISLNSSDTKSAVKYYSKAYEKSSLNAVKYKLDIAIAYILEKNYSNAFHELEAIINYDDIGFNEKNRAEELLAFTKQKMTIYSL